MHLLLTSASLLLVVAIQTAQSINSVCEVPSDINFASVTEVSDDTYSIGTTVTYSCQFGYVASGKSRNIRCISSGGYAEWTEPQFSCMPQSCGDPGFVTNGQRVGSLFTFPNSVRYVCDTGYKLRGIATRYCQTSGTWSGRLPVCEVLTCDPPKNPENGHVTASSYEYGSELNYKCDKGFSLSTDETVYCTEDGSWSTSDITCIETVCEIPERPQNGYVRFHGSDERPRAGSIAIFSCEGDRVASGPTTSKCLDIGEWTFPPPKCLEPCSIQQVPNGAFGKYEGYGRRRVFKQLRYTSRIEDYEELFLRCYKGFEVAGYGNQEVRVSCNKGKWSLEPVCEPASCRFKPRKVANAEIVARNTEHGGTVSYRCLSDYRKVTEETVFCDYGEWKGDPPTCKSTKCSVHTLTSPGLLKGLKDFYSDGEVFQVTCDNRHRLAEGSSGQIRCEAGSWDEDFPPCIAANCLVRPPPIEHGYVKNPSEKAHGSVASYVCDDPYVLVGDSLVQCAFGHWDGKPPQCQDTRCYLKDFNNLRHVSRNTQSVTLSGDRPNIICVDGYSAKKNLPICRNGEWDSRYQSLCEESDCKIPTIWGGSIREESFGDWYWTFTGYKRTLAYIIIPAGNIVSSGSVLWFLCDDRYSVLGKGIPSLQIKCFRGKWSTDLQCLREGERYVPSTTESILKQFTSTPEPFHSSSTPTTKSIPPLTTPSSSDVEGTSPTDLDDGKPESRVTPHLPTEPPAEQCFCEYTVYDDNIIAHADGNRLIDGDKVQNGSTVVFHCKHVGYHRFTGNREITCNNCQPWRSSDFPYCTAPSKGDAAIVLGNDVDVLEDGKIELYKGQSVNFTCVAMEAALHPQWSYPEVPGISVIRERKYREDQGDVVYFTHLEIQNAASQNEGTYECSTEGDHTATIHVIVTDPDLRCPEFPEDDGIIIKYEGERQENGKVSFSCPKKGQELIGKPLLTCLRTGKWSDPPPSCSGIRCEKLKTTDLLQIEYSSEREPGSYAAFHCSVPGKRTGVSFSLCQENGTWTYPAPSCTIPSCSLDELRSSFHQNVTLIDINEDNNYLPYNSTVKLICENGMIAVGNPVAKCEQEGNWKIDKVQCASGCQPPTKPISSRLVLSPEEEIYKFGEKLTFTCPPGMSLIEGPQVIMCLKIGWSETDLPKCKENDNYKDSSDG